MNGVMLDFRQVFLLNTAMHSTLGNLSVLCRIIAGAVGAEALYIAIFMYEDGKRKWVNRLEAFWLEVYDRAKHTDTVFTALVNNVSRQLMRAANRAFGSGQFTVKLVTVSLYLSYIVGLVTSYAIRPAGTAYIRLNNLPELVVLVILILFTVIAIISEKDWVHAAFVGLLVIYLTFHLAGEQMAVTGVNPFDPENDPSNLMSEHPVQPHLSDFFRLYSPRYAALFASEIALLCSVLIDVAALIVIRWLCKRLAGIVRVRFACSGIMALLVLAIAAGPLPEYIALRFTKNNFSEGYLPYSLSASAAPDLLKKIFIVNLASYIGLMNTTTFLFCLIPCTILLCLLLHRALWPLLARATYPLLALRVIQERKILIPIGTFALGYALGGEYVWLKIIEKLSS